MALELLVIVPLVIFFLLLITGLGRYIHDRQLVDDATAAAARAASLAPGPAQATTDAQHIAQDVLSQGGLTCEAFSAQVDVTQFRPGGQVSVALRCTSQLRAPAVGLPRAVTFSATSTSPLEKYRAFTGTQNP